MIQKEADHLDPSFPRRIVKGDLPFVVWNISGFRILDAGAENEKKKETHFNGETSNTKELTCESKSSATSGFPNEAAKCKGNDPSLALAILTIPGFAIVRACMTRQR
jgi:hypothetical protein